MHDAAIFMITPIRHPSINDGIYSPACQSLCKLQKFTLFSGHNDKELRTRNHRESPLKVGTIFISEAPP